MPRRTASSIALAALALGACDRATPPGAVPPTGSGAPPASQVTFTAAVLAATIAADCPDPAPATGAAAASADRARSLPAPTMADETAGDAALRRERAGCEQTEVQLKLDLHGAATAQVRLRSVEILTAAGTGAAVTPRAPRQWDPGTSTYTPWDQRLADGQSVTVSYRLSAPPASGPGSYTIKVTAEAVLPDGTVVPSAVSKLIDVAPSPMVMT